MTTIVWFREDLRLADNPALSWAVKRGAVLPLYIEDDQTPGLRRLGGAARWWLHHSLNMLREDLRAVGSDLMIQAGDPLAVIQKLVKQFDVSAVAWNHLYTQPAMARDMAIQGALRSQGLSVQTANGNLLFEPDQVRTQSDGAFKVFSPFWKTISARPIDAPLPRPTSFHSPQLPTTSLHALALLPATSNWANGWEGRWTPGERGAIQALSDRMEPLLAGYREMRDLPAIEGTSRLSPHLRFGEISARQAWHITHNAMHAADDPSQAARNGWSYLREIGWREFSHHMLVHFPTLGLDNWRPEFDAFPWSNREQWLGCWQRGKTGYPIVDAGMRQLWQTGWMHNRVRMIVASFLIKHLLTDWRLGEHWFWDTLIDACPANNPAGWQWVAGSGADASPYFRIFNPITQSEKFDGKGDYIRRWVPELRRLDDRSIHQPWTAGPLILGAAGVRLGQTYPNPIVDHNTARQVALRAYDSIKKKAA